MKDKDSQKLIEKPFRISEPSNLRNPMVISEQNIMASLGRIIAGSYYDHQEVRITENNRVRDIIRRKLEGIKFNEVEEKKDDKDKYKSKFVDKKIPIYLKQLVKDKKLSETEERYILKILQVQKNAEKYEKEYQSLMMEYIKNEKIYTEFLQHIKGIGPVLSCNFIKEFGYCEKAHHISSLWKYCGMHVVNGYAPKRKKGEKLDFDLKMRTMVWKVSDSFIKQRTPFYRDIYDKEKERQKALMKDSHLRIETQVKEASHEKNEKPLNLSEPNKSRKPYPESDNKIPKSLLHCDLRARRKMIKIFLSHYWMACKELSQPPNKRNPRLVSDNQPYIQAIHNHKHITDWKFAVMRNVGGKNE